MTTLQVLWFALIGVLVSGYAVLDGFDLGIGWWHLFHRKPDRQILLACISPVWDGNEVWLLTAAGAVFAVFPPVYAAVFSGMYLVMVMVLFGLILRAVAIEFRSLVESGRWQTFWDWCFALGSIVPALLLGVAIGNVLHGIPLDAAGDYAGEFLDLLNPFALLVGLTALAMFATHGAIFLAIKTQGDLSGNAVQAAKRAWLALLILVLVTITGSVFLAGARWVNVLACPGFFAAPVVVLLLLIGMRWMLARGELGRAFALSALFIIGMVGLVALALFPTLVPASNDPALSLTIARTASSERTLLAMLIVALVGMPFVAWYTVFAYRAFRGKARPEDLSY